MRTILMLAVLGVATAFSATAAAAGAGLRLTAEGLARPAKAGPIYVKARVDADSDADGPGDAAVLRLHCDGTRLAAAALRYEVATAREAGSGLATGRRPTTSAPAPVKEWGPATPQFRALLPRIRIATITGDADGWRPVALAASEGLCPAAEAATRGGAGISRSNVKNN